mmetsp:Transcript_30036/g.55408  ORF Transcript_30036/g.55408 Transcript_30036/m.55408 type:complete len:396 (-) Transcript_30036:367-1554(-)
MATSASLSGAACAKSLISSTEDAASCSSSNPSRLNFLHEDHCTKSLGLSLLSGMVSDPNHDLSKSSKSEGNGARPLARLTSLNRGCRSSLRRLGTCSKGNNSSLSRSCSKSSGPGIQLQFLHVVKMSSLPAAAIIVTAPSGCSPPAAARKAGEARKEVTPLDVSAILESLLSRNKAAMCGATHSRAAKHHGPRRPGSISSIAKSRASSTNSAGHKDTTCSTRAGSSRRARRMPCSSSSSKYFRQKNRKRTAPSKSAGGVSGAAAPDAASAHGSKPCEPAPVICCRMACPESAWKWSKVRSQSEAASSANVNSIACPSCQVSNRNAAEKYSELCCNTALSQRISQGPWTSSSMSALPTNIRTSAAEGGHKHSNLNPARQSGGDATGPLRNFSKAVP